MRTHRHRHRNYPYLLFLVISVVNPWNVLFAQKDNQFSPSDLKKLSVEELMNIEVTSVSRSPEKLTEVASAIQVITHEDIRRSTVTRLPEALRLASNLQVAQSNAHDWAVTARGFNGAPLANSTLADKLLVMIDGRTVYTPLFGGVFWDAQNVLLEDIDRIEVVSGPGGSLWGANAVNGVINIMSKKASESQGLYASASAGSFLQDHVGIRYGGQADSNFHYRVYGQRFDHKNTLRTADSSSYDAWNMTQGGFRMDFAPSKANSFTIQGDLYVGKSDTNTTLIDGQNLSASWTHTFSEESGMTLQAYFDRTWRDLTDARFWDQLVTGDIDFQHHFSIGANHQMLWGAGYRVQENTVLNTPELSFFPPRRLLNLFNGFVQDRIMVIDTELYLTLGTKLLHNDYSGLDLQPSARLTWTPDERQTIWGAVSRAVRTPSRFDADERTPFISTRNGEFDSEKVVAYELGYRFRPLERISFSLATFYKRYDDLRSINRSDGGPTPLLFANDQRARSWGLEFSGNAIAFPWWRLRGGYTFLYKEFSTKSDAVLAGSDLFEGLDPRHQVLLQSMIDLGDALELDIVGRFVDALPGVGAVAPDIPAYATFDVRLAWIFKQLELSVAGQNLAEKSHSEFGYRRIPRSIYIKGTLRF